jgi:hypothetical protein
LECRLRSEDMADQLSVRYSDLLDGSYDCVDRVVLNAYFGMGQTGGGLRVWWRALHGSDDNLDDNHLMRMAGQRCGVRLGDRFCAVGIDPKATIRK